MQLRFVWMAFEAGEKWISEPTVVQSADGPVETMKRWILKPEHVGQVIEFDDPAYVLANYPGLFEEV